MLKLYFNRRDRLDDFSTLQGRDESISFLVLTG